MKIINEFEMFATRQLTPDKDIYADIEININNTVFIRFSAHDAFLG